MLFVITGCNNSQKEVKEEAKSQQETKDEAEISKDEDAKKKGPKETEVEKNGEKLEETQEGVERASIIIALEPFTESFDVNGVFIGDTVDHVVEVLGEVLDKPYGDERFDYYFQDASYDEKLMVVFDDLGVVYIQADSSTEEGVLLTDEYFEHFTGKIYKATDEVAKDFSAISIYVYFVNAESILVVEKYEDENTGVGRTYMIAPEYNWLYSRGWDIKLFEDENKFIQVDTITAIAEQ
jgi:hypothetical protein